MKTTSEKPATKKPERLRIGFNSSAFSERERTILADQSRLEQIENRVKETGIPRDEINLQNLVADPQGYMIKFLPETVKQLVGIVTEDSLNWPPSFIALIDEVKQMKKQLPQLVNSSEYFTFGKNGLQPNHTKWDELEQSCTYFTEEVDRYGKLDELAKLLTHFSTNERKLDRIGLKEQLGKELTKYFEFDGIQFTVNPKTFTQLTP